MTAGTAATISVSSLRLRKRPVWEQHSPWEQILLWERFPTAIPSTSPPLLWERFSTATGLSAKAWSKADRDYKSLPQQSLHKHQRGLRILVLSVDFGCRFLKSATSSPHVPKAENQSFKIQYPRRS